MELKKKLSDRFHFTLLSIQLVRTNTKMLGSEDTHLMFLVVSRKIKSRASNISDFGK